MVYMTMKGMAEAWNVDKQRVYRAVKRCGAQHSHVDYNHCMYYNEEQTRLIKRELFPEVAIADSEAAIGMSRDDSNSYQGVAFEKYVATLKETTEVLAKQLQSNADLLLMKEQQLIAKDSLLQKKDARIEDLQGQLEDLQQNRVLLQEKNEKIEDLLQEIAKRDEQITIEMELCHERDEKIEDLQRQIENLQKKKKHWWQRSR